LFRESRAEIKINYELEITNYELPSRQ
jgi:hypothetical protein